MTTWWLKTYNEYTTLDLTLSFFDLLMAFKGLSTRKTRNDLIASFCKLSSVPMLRKNTQQPSESMFEFSNSQEQNI